MPSDPRARRAREAHRLAGAAEQTAKNFRLQRDALVRELYREDPVCWTYSRIGVAIGLSAEHVGAIIRGPR